MLLFSGSFVGLMLLPIDFPYWAFALLILLNGVSNGMFASPNTSSIMGSVPAGYRGAASGMRATFQNSGTALSIGLFFSLMIAGLAADLPHTRSTGLPSHGVPADVAGGLAALPPVATMFAAILGVNPIQHLLAPTGVLGHLPAGAQQTLTGREFFPHLIAGPFHTGLVVVFATGAVLGLVSALASLLRGGHAVSLPGGDSPEPTEPAAASGRRR
jgi:hypothetical protein